MNHLQGWVEQGGVVVTGGPGGSGTGPPPATVTVGGPVAGGIAKSVLFVDSAGNLAQDNPSLVYDIPSKTLSVANLSAASVTATGTIQANTLSAPTITSTGNITGLNVTANNVMNAATLNVGTVAATGNITAVNMTGTGTVQGATVTSTGAITAAGNMSTTTGTVSGSNVTATNTLTGTTLTIGTVTATGNISGVNITGSGTIQGATVTATGTLNAANATVTGLITGNVNYNEGGTGAVNRTVQGRLQDIVSVKDFGAVGDNSHNDAPNIQAAINAVGSNGQIYFPAGNYRVNSPLTITGDRLYLTGAGPMATMIWYYPTAANTTCLTVSKSPPTADISQGGISGIAFFSTNNSFVKTAINLVAVSNYIVRDVWIWGSPGSIYWGDSSRGSIALQFNGHELTTVENFFTYADRPLVIGPNSTGSTLSLDKCTFRDCTLAARGNPCVECLDNVGLTDVTFEGRQGWSGGTYGFKWINTIGTSSYYGLKFDNLRWEQTEGGPGWSIYIALTAGGNVRRLTVHNAYMEMGGNCSGFYFRNVIAADFRNVIYGGVATALNVDSSDSNFIFWNMWFGLAPPAAAISAAVRASNVVTLTIPAGLNFSAGQSITVAGVSDATFNGVALTVTSYTGTSLVYSSTGTDTTLGAGGTVALTAMVLGSPAFADFISYNQIGNSAALSTAAPARLSMGSFDLTGYMNLPYKATINGLNRSGVSKRMISLSPASIGTTDPVQIDQDAAGTVLGGSLYTGNALTTNSLGPGIVIPNNASLLGVNAAGNNTLLIAKVYNNNTVTFGGLGVGYAGTTVNGGSGNVIIASQLQLNVGLVALGGGLTPTFGTMGGTGPATAAQNSWLQININGVNSWVPVWR